MKMKILLMGGDILGAALWRFKLIAVAEWCFGRFGIPWRILLPKAISRKYFRRRKLNKVGFRCFLSLKIPFEDVIIFGVLPPDILMAVKMLQPAVGRSVIHNLKKSWSRKVVITRSNCLWVRKNLIKNNGKPIYQILLGSDHVDGSSTAGR